MELIKGFPTFSEEKGWELYQDFEWIEHPKDVTSSKFNWLEQKGNDFMYESDFNFEKSSDYDFFGV